MASKRDRIGEIQNRRHRMGGPQHILHLFARLHGLLEELDSAAKVSEELVRYFPIAMVACLESYTRLIVEELIDTGAPFADRLGRFEHIKLDMNTMKAIHGRRVTLGELVAHAVPVNNLNDIKDALGLLLGQDLIDVVKATLERWTSDGVALDSTADTIGALIRGAESTFEMRHIYAHEFSPADAVDRQSIVDSVHASATLLSAVDDGIMHLRFPNAMPTASDMRHFTAERTAQAVRDLEDFVAKELSELGHEKEVAEAQEAWALGRDRTARLFAALQADDDEMGELYFNRAAEAITRNRISELQTLLDLRF